MKLGEMAQYIWNRDVETIPATITIRHRIASSKTGRWSKPFTFHTEMFHPHQFSKYQEKIAKKYSGKWVQVSYQVVRDDGKEWEGCVEGSWKFR